MTTNHSGGGTPITDASELDALVIDMPGQQTTDKVVRSIIARQLERNLSAAQSALAEKEREVEKNTIERCAKAAADVPHSTPFASRVITACVVAIRSLKSAPPASPTGRKEGTN